MLKRLHQEGLVTFDVVPQTGKPDRKVYCATDQGGADFLAWLRGPVTEADSHTLMPFLLRFLFYGMLDKETLLFRMREVLVARQRMLDRHLEWAGFVAPEAAKPMVDPQSVARVWELMADYGGKELALQVAWLKESITRMERDA